MYGDCHNDSRSTRCTIFVRMQLVQHLQLKWDYLDRRTNVALLFCAFIRLFCNYFATLVWQSSYDAAQPFCKCWGRFGTIWERPEFMAFAKIFEQVKKNRSSLAKIWRPLRTFGAALRLFYNIFATVVNHSRSTVAKQFLPKKYYLEDSHLMLCYVLLAIRRVKVSDRRGWLAMR